MSYTSESVLPRSAKLAQLEELIVLLGYRRGEDGLKVPARIGSFFWHDKEDFKSYAGVGLDIYRHLHGPIQGDDPVKCGQKLLGSYATEQDD